MTAPYAIDYFFYFRTMAQKKRDRKAYMAKWRASNRANINAKHKVWRDQNPEKMAEYIQRRDAVRSSEQAAKWRQENPNYASIWFQKNKEKRAEYLREWRRKKKELNL